MSEEELDEIGKDMVVLKKQPPATYPPSAETEAAMSRLMKFAHATGAYAAKQAENFVTAAVKKSGEKIVDLAFWSAIIYELGNLAEIAIRWRQLLGPHL